MNFFLLLILSFSVFAQENIDSNLASYIKDFQLTTVRPPSAMRKKLFQIGNSLFFDKDVSGNRNIRCIDCHHPRLNTQEGIPLSLGEGATGFEFGSGHRTQGTGRVLARNTPALFNLHNVQFMFWDGRVSFNSRTGRLVTPMPLKPDAANVIKSALAAQAIFPMVDHDEMRGQKGSNDIADAQDEYEAWDIIVSRIMSKKSYQEAFAEVYPGETINIGHFGEALAEFQAQAFYFTDTPFDRYLKGDKKALTPLQKKGMDVFFRRGDCGLCHGGEHLAIADFHNVGVPQIGPGKQNGNDFGRYQINPKQEFKYAFRVPPLRNVAVTAPYFHNGAYATLEEVVEHYNDIPHSLSTYRVADRIVGQLKNYLSPLKDHDQNTNAERVENISFMILLRLNLTKDEKEALVDFLKTGLTDDRLK